MREIEIYISPQGGTPLSRFMNSLPAPLRAKLARDIDLLIEFGPSIGEPYVKKLRGTSPDLWELRTRRASDHVRTIFSVLENNRIILLHGFVKKTGRIPRREIETAEQRLKQYLEIRR
jgi:phage-related protein